MATFLRFITVLCLLVSGGANAYIWHITDGRASAWDVMKWPTLLPNIWRNPETTVSQIYAAAIFPTLFAAIMIAFWVARRIGGLKVKMPAKDKSADAGKSGSDNGVPFRGVVIPGLGTSTSEMSAAKEKGVGAIGALKGRLSDAGGDLKAAFGIDFKAWRLNRIKAHGNDKMVACSGEEGGLLARLFSRKKAVVKPQPLLVEGANVSKVDAREEAAFEIMEWYGVWGKAGPTGRTESMEVKAYELKVKATQEVQDLIMDRHQHNGISAIEALLSATMHEKGIGGFAEDEAAPVEQPETEDLIDPELHAPRAEVAFGESDELSDDEFREEPAEAGEGEETPETLQRPQFDPDNLKNFFDRYRTAEPGKAEAEEGDGFETMRKAGQGSAADFLGVLADNQRDALGAGEGREGEEIEGGVNPASDSEGSGESATGEGDSANEWSDDLPWDGGSTTPAETPAEDEMPAGRDWQKFRVKDEEVDAALGLPVASDLPTWGTEEKAGGAGETSSPYGSLPQWNDSDVDTNPVAAETNADVSTSWRNDSDPVEEDGAVSALLASVSPNGPIGDVQDEDLKERPEDLAVSASTRISPEEMDKTIRKMDKNWLRFVTGEVDKGARSLEREFVQAGLADLKTRHVFVPALWAQLNKVVDYQTQAYAWEHFGDTPPETLRTARQRAEFLFDVVTSIAALAKQIPGDDLAELLAFKAGTEQARWLAAGRAERMVAELKKSGAAEPAKQSDSLPATVRVAPAQSANEATIAFDEIENRRRMTEAAIVMARPRKETPEAQEAPEALDIPDEELVEEDGNLGWGEDRWEPDYGQVDDEAPSDLPSSNSPVANNPVGDEQAPVDGAGEETGEVSQTGSDDTQSGNFPSSPDLPLDGPAGGSPSLSFEEQRMPFLADIVTRAEKDGLRARLGMRFTSHTSATEAERTADVVIGKTMTEMGAHQVPTGRRLVVMVVIDIPEGQWRVSKGENGRPQLKWAGKVIELRTWAFRLAEMFFKQTGAEEVRNVLVLRMDPLATIEDGEGNSDKDAVAHVLDDEISVKQGTWSAGEWREQVVMPVLG